jgi:glycosyltransferase involved in cell wall biosynthesis
MFSLVSTVLNDREGTASFFKQMAAQKRTPDETVIVDGGSSDGTWELLMDESRRTEPGRLVVLQERGCNVARGRNIAIVRASHDIIVSTDIGCDWDPEWLQELVSPLYSDPAIEIVVGSWGVKESELAGPWAKTEYALKGGLLQTSSTPQTQATSRSIAYRRNLWRRLGGYPDDLTLAADDTTFDLLVKSEGAPAAAAPRIRCYWHRHQRLGSFLKEQYRYFYGNGEANISGRHFILVGGRLSVEILGLLAGIPALAFTVTRWWGIAAISVSLLSMALRFRRWIPAARRLSAMAVDHPLGRIVLFETLCRVHGLRGWLRGWVRGFKYCRDCRMRLARAGGGQSVK